MISFLNDILISHGDEDESNFEIAFHNYILHPIYVICNTYWHKRRLVKITGRLLKVLGCLL